MTVCIVVLGNPDSPDSNSERDASPELLTRLRSALPGIAPRDSCRLNEHHLLVDLDGRPALQLGVGTLEWVARDFVKVEAYWLRGGLWGATYRYTVSLVGTEWRVDTASVFAIS